jgi:hypothetical protein
LNKIEILRNLLAKYRLNTLKEETESYDPIKMTMISSGQISPSESIIYKKSEFDLVLNKELDTAYLQTTDIKFKTPEGYFIGYEWDKIYEQDQKEIERMAGWGYYIRLESGWQLGFCEGETCTDSVPTNRSKIDWIFRRGNG